VALLLWVDHLGSSHNSTLLPSLGSTSSYLDGVATGYIFGASDDRSGISLDAVAGITNMQFIIDGKLEDQGGVGFPMQDAVAFSATSCLFFNNFTANITLQCVSLSNLYVAVVTHWQYRCAKS
jgi:hypothetical protein